MKQPQACKHLRNAILTGGTALIAGSAQAQSQSNLILYGVMDAGIEYLSHFSDKVPTAANGYATGAGYNTVRMSSGNLAGSRFGMRGEEDLGGGLKALFVLESGFTADDGRLAFNGRLFGRQVVAGAEHPPVRGQVGRLEHPGDPEVGQLGLALGRQEDVRRLDVAVDDTGGVGRVSDVFLVITPRSAKESDGLRDQE